MRQDKLYWIPAVLLMLSLLAVGVLTLAGVKGNPPAYNERRTMAVFPEFQWEKIGNAKYFQETDAFVNDNFFGRGWALKLSEMAVPNWRKDLVYGRDGWLFIRFINEVYAGLHPTDEIELEKSIRSLARLTKAQGKTLVIEFYRNKPFIYWDKLPAIWQKYISADPEEIPAIRVAERIRSDGTAVIVDHTQTLLRLRSRGSETFSSLPETHVSPTALFETNKELVRAIAAALSHHVRLPDDFPKRYYADLDPVRGWQGWFHTEALMPPAPGVSVDVFSLDDQLLLRHSNSLAGFDAETKPVPAATFTYKNPLGDAAPLPRAYIFSDSFFYHGATYLSSTIFPYFKSATFHYNNTGIDGWDEASIVIISNSDQSVRGLAANLRSIVEKVEANKRQ